MNPKFFHNFGVHKNVELVVENMILLMKVNFLHVLSGASC